MVVVGGGGQSMVNATEVGTYRSGMGNSPDPSTVQQSNSMPHQHGDSKGGSTAPGNTNETNANQTASTPTPNGPNNGFIPLQSWAENANVYDQCCEELLDVGSSYSQNTPSKQSAIIHGGNSKNIGPFVVTDELGMSPTDYQIGIDAVNDMLSIPSGPVFDAIKDFNSKGKTIEVFVTTRIDLPTAAHPTNGVIVLNVNPKAVFGPPAEDAPAYIKVAHEIGHYHRYINNTYLGPQNLTEEIQTTKDYENPTRKYFKARLKPLGIPTRRPTVYGQKYK